MLKKTTLFAVVTLAIFSCKKSSSGGPNPSGKDTAYLMKTEIDYNYDASGKKSADSSLVTWTYDSKRRLIKEVHDFDTLNTTYTANQIILDHASYSNGVVVRRNHDVTFYDGKGYVDSTRVFQISYHQVNGSTTTKYDTTVTVYYNDADGKDTLQVSYEVKNSVRVKGDSRRKKLTGGALSTDEVIGANGIRTYLGEWTDGNIMKVTGWAGDGTLLFEDDYTYSYILSGGFYLYEINKNLVSTFAETNFIGVGGYTENDTYTFDDANRVSTLTRRYSDRQSYDVSVYTYY